MELSSMEDKKNTKIEDTCAVCGFNIEGTKHSPGPYDNDPSRPYCCKECFDKHVIPDSRSLNKFLGQY